MSLTPRSLSSIMLMAAGYGNMWRYKEESKHRKARVMRAKARSRKK